MRGRFRQRGRIGRYRMHLLAIGLTAALAFAVGSGGASTPSSQLITVPSSTGQTATVNWTGTILPGSHATSDCATVSGDPTVDHHGIQLTVPAGLYSSVNAQFSFSITWTPGTPTEDTADEILTVLDPTATEVGSSDRQLDHRDRRHDQPRSGHVRRARVRVRERARPELLRLADDHDELRGGR